ncbi:MAG: LAGLIDADG family homing endonuclease [Methanothrix sp.]|nr:LAGLIDADG family homing endonuclease [Methanothrix sp.]
MPADPVAKWEEFLRTRYWDELLELADSYPDERSLKISFPDIDKFDPDFAEELLENPDTNLEAAQTALLELDLPMDVYLDRAHVRIIELPRAYKTRDLRSDHIGKLLAIDGLVRTATEVRPKIVSAAFQCQRCGFTFFKEQTGNKFEDQNLKCMNQACDRGGPFKLLLDQSKFVDAQKIRVQESPEDLRGGAQPQTLDVELEDDLAGKIFPGDRVIVNGVLKQFQRSSPQQGKSTYFDLFHKGISVEMTEQDFEEIDIDPEEEKEILEMAQDPEIYEKIKGSISPSIYGYDDVKEALALQLVSGFEKHLPDGARIRGDIHILLVGDPGIAKSQLLRYMIKISPRGIYTSGKSSTSAGLTATAVKDELGDGRWTIEAGALVLADKGIAAIDEMDKMDNEDKSALHEAMEQQSYHPLTEIQLADGRKVRIGEFVDRLMADRDSEIIKGKDCEILPLDGQIKIRSTDLERIFDLPLDRVSRHLAPKNFIKIRYSNGREIIVTPEHPIYISNDEIKCVPACDANVGDLAPAPRSIPLNLNSANLFQVEIDHPREKSLHFPEEMNPSLSRILGYLLAEGHYYKGSSHEIGFTNKDEFLLQEMSSLMQESFGITASRNQRSDGVLTLRFISTRLFRWFEANFEEMMRTGRERRIPAAVFHSTENDIREFLISAFLGDGCVHSTSVAYSTVSRGLAEDYQDLLLRAGISSRISIDRKANAFKVCIMGDSHRRFENLFSSFSHEKLDRMRGITSACSRSIRHHDVLPAQTALSILQMKKSLGLVNDGRFNEHLAKGYGLTLDTVAESAGYLKNRYNEVLASLDEELTLPEMRMALGWSQSYMASVARITRGNIDYYEQGGYDASRRVEFAKHVRQKVHEHLKETGIRIGSLEKRISADIRYLRITDVDVIPNQGEYAADYVYDITVEPTHTFISQGLVLHNTISVAKAGVMATLKSRCSLLAAANPKLGRFDKYEPIAPQINLTPALMSRFDLIFVLTDDPDTKRDSAIAQHILKSNYAGELATQAEWNDDISQEDIDNSLVVIKPALDPELLRKYVAYARKNIFPSLSDEAKQYFLNYYVGLRSQGQDSNKPVPVTARQLEALIRLGEASARLRLSDKVAIDDAKRVVRILEACLRKVGVDPETGFLDADIIASGTTKSTRDRTKTVMDIIRDISREQQGQAPVDAVLDRAEELGIERAKAEEIIARMRRDGSVFEPRPGMLKVL